ncbi:MAG: universal stress protein [Bacteroidales bacterium]|jgi:nucleotide-binding universal stress UspA family protein
MKTIIVPLDFSNESLDGLNMALMLAKKTGAKVQMIHVIGKKIENNKELLDKENLLATRKFEEILQKCKDGGNINCALSFTVKEGKIFSEITTLADRFEDSIIVLSTHGESGFEELFIGGNAYKIASHSKNPVITVRKCKLSTDIARIVLPLDITLQTRGKVPYTVELAKLFDSEIHLITVRGSHLKSIEKKLYKYTEQVCSYFWDHDIPYKVEHLQGGNLTDLILEYSVSANADLISIMTEQERSVSNILLGTYAHQMINKARIPVLSFPSYHLGNYAEDF